MKIFIPIIFLLLSSKVFKANSIYLDSISDSLPLYKDYPLLLKLGISQVEQLEGIEKVKLIVQITDELDKSDPNGVLYFSEIIINYAESYDDFFSEEDYHLAYGVGRITKARALTSLGKVAEAEVLFKQTIIYLNNQNLYKQEAFSKVLLSHCYYLQGKNKEGIKEGKEAIFIYEKLKVFDNLGTAQHRIGSCYTNIGQLDSALIYLLKAAEIIDSLGNGISQLEIKISLAVCYSRMQEFEKAEELAKEGLNLAQKISHVRLEAVLLNILGGNYVQRGDYELGKKYLEEAIPLLKKNKDQINLSNALNNLGTALFFQNKLLESLKYNKQAFQVAMQVNNSQLLAPIYSSMGNTYAKLNDFDKAIFYLEKCIIYSEQMENIDFQRIAFNDLAVAYVQMGDYQKALETVQKSFEKEKELFTIEKEKTIKDAETKYETAKKEAQIQFKNIIISLLILLIAGFSILSYLLKKAEAKIKVLYEEEKHRIKNNLSFAASVFGLQEENIQDQSTKKVVVENRNRIEAIGLLHQKLSLDKKKASMINAEEYLRDLIDNLSFTFDPNSKVKLNSKFDSIEIDADKLMRIGLIINELVTNSFKHVFVEMESPQINISLEKTKQTTLLVEDNGKGLPNVETISSKSFGLKLIDMLVKQINGNLKISNNPGARYEIIFD